MKSDEGIVEGIYVAPAATAPMVSMQEAVALAGRGLVGDRYSERAGTFSDWPKDHEFTLIEAEAIDAIRDETGIELAAGITRRNVMTRGVRLNDWVGREFQIGSVRCAGTRLCPPCEHLRGLLGIAKLMEIMKGRGGLRARILNDGSIRLGDRIAVALETDALRTVQ